MPLRYKNFHRNSLRCAAPPTPEQPDFASANPHISRPRETRNPPVLQPLEMACSGSKHPLSSVSGRRRYNTLDFPTENRVPTGRFHPYWKPGIKGICSPFTIPAVLKSVPTKRKIGVFAYISQNTKNPTVDPTSRRGKSVGISYAAFTKTSKNSCIIPCYNVTIISICTFHFTRSSQVPFSESYQTEQRTLSQ